MAADIKALNFKESNISFALKHHDPPKNLHSKRSSPSEIKYDVLESPRIRRVVREKQQNSGSKCCYPKDLLYLSSGEELQLEQVRALLPQYLADGGACDMEMTVSYTANITTMIPSSSSGVLSSAQNVYNQHLPMGQQHRKISPDLVLEERRPSNNIIKQSLVSAEDQLEMLCKNKLCLLPDNMPKERDCDEKFEQQMDQLILDKDNMSAMSCQSIQQDQKLGKDPYYGFTPDTLEGGVNWPTRATKNVVNTKLSFTDAESMSRSHSHLVYNDDSKCNGSLAFNITSDLERKAKILCSEQNCENDFMLTEFERVSDSNGDKMCCKSDGLLIGNRRVLQPVTTQKSFFISGHSRNNMSVSQSSFSVYEDPSHNESSFIPYHDSMQTSKSYLADPVPQTYCAPLGVPLHPEQQLPSEQTFTQFDIPHPNEFGSVSTPCTSHRFQNLTFDLSVIPTIEEKCSEEDMVIPVSRLSTIAEESSGNSKLTSSSSSRFTVSSSNSSSQSEVSGSSEHPLGECNPFLPDIVNRMLNSLGGVPQGVMEELMEPILPIVEKKGVVLKKEVFHSLSLLADGIFSKTYLASGDLDKKVLKIHKVPFEWEITIVNGLLPHRLKMNGLHELSNRFQHYDKVYRLPCSSYISLSSYHAHGTVQNVIDRGIANKRLIPEAIVLFLSSEMLLLVDYLHQCGVIHAAIKPGHFLICDQRESPGGLGLYLIDFGKSIDTKQFSEEQWFSGLPVANDVCPYSELIDGHPWKWQIDYYGLAMCIITLIVKEAPVIIRNVETDLYTWSGKPSPVYRKYAWKNIIQQLLNPVPTLALKELQESLKEKLTAKDYKFWIPTNLDPQLY